MIGYNKRAAHICSYPPVDSSIAVLSIRLRSVKVNRGSDQGCEMTSGGLITAGIVLTHPLFDQGFHTHSEPWLHSVHTRPSDIPSKL